MRILLVFLLLCTAAWAGPGAHGPNGEHLDAPTTHSAQTAYPQLETHSESFELFAELQPHHLQVWVDRYDSNEPVLKANLELEIGSLKVQAQFDAQQGMYQFTDAALLKQLQQSGQHGLVFTLTTEQEADLLEGSLPVHAPAKAVQESKLQWNNWYLGGLLLPLMLVWVWRKRS